MRFSNAILRLFRNYLPSPFTLAVLLTVLTFLMALIMTDPAADNPDPHVLQVFGYWHGGIWDLLAFAMQMMLMLVLGHVLALSRTAGHIIDSSLVFCKDAATAALVVTFLTVLVSLFNWGLGLIFGAILARKVGEYATKNRIPINYGLIGAAGYSGLMVWHGGVSGSAPLKVAEAGHQFENLTGGVPISVAETLGSGMNITISIALLLILPTAMFLLARSSKTEIPSLTDRDQKGIEEGPETPAEQLDYSRILSLLFGACLLFMFFYIFWFQPGTPDLSAINPNLINLLLLALCLILHPNFNSFLKAVDKAIKGSSGIMIQFPLYAGIMGIMAGSGLVNQFSNFFVDISNETTFPLFTLFSAGAVNFFVPSGGGQWAVQGGIVLQAANELGVSPAKAVMALSYGDQLTNMLQPFWALPLLGITGLKAGRILPYTMFLMLVGLAIFITGLLVF